MLLVNEIYGPVKQGEGKSAGMDTMFLRLSGCNLACVWCDTPYTWNWIGTKFEHPDKYDKEKEVHKMSIDDVFTRIVNKARDIRSLVVSGGEPLLQQKYLTKLFEILWIERQEWIEVETNGTIVPTPEFSKYVTQFNCSPKLSNAGKDNPRSKRLNFEALEKINLSGKQTFKFVIQSDQDIAEMMEILTITNIRPNDVWIMPEGRTREEQLSRQEQVKKLAEEGMRSMDGTKYKFNFSPRLHILEFDTMRAV